MRVFSVMWQRWRSHHSIRHSRKPHAARKLHGSIFYRTGFIVIGVLHCMNRKFRVFAAVTLTLTRWPSYTILTRMPWSYTQRSRFSTVIALHTCTHTDRQTYRHTYRHYYNYYMHCFSGDKNAAMITCYFNYLKYSNWLDHLHKLSWQEQSDQWCD